MLTTAFWFPVGALLGAAVVIVGEFIDRKKQRRIVVAVGAALMAVITYASTVSNARQQGRIEALSSETRDLVTGGKAFAWLRLVEVKSSQHSPAKELRAFFVHDGDDVPVFDIDTVFAQTGACDEFESWTMAEALISRGTSPRRYSVPVLTASTIRSMPAALEPACDDAHYLAVLQMRNRSVIQQLLLHRGATKWDVSTRAIDLRTKEVLFETIDPDAGAIQWPDYNRFTAAF